MALDLDEVRLLVAGDPWMKTTMTPGKVRVQLARAAVGDDPYLRVDDREVRRDGPTFTADTLEELSVEEPGTAWWFILGVDAANSLPRWQRVDAALELATFVVVSRPGYDADLVADVAARVVPLEVPLIGVSSSDVRARVARGGSIRYLVPAGVVRSIDELALYVRTHG